MKKLAIVTTHPIQYNAPLFQLLAQRATIQIRVFYTWEQAWGKVFDPGFGRSREWDLPLLEGYNHTFVQNTARDPGSHHFWGVRTPSLVTEIEAWLPDAVLVFGWSYASHLNCLRYFSGKLPVFFRGDSTLLDEGHRLRTVFRRSVLKWVYKNIDIAFYVGVNNRAYFKKHGLRNTQLVKALHAVDGNRFQHISKESEAEAKRWRAALGFSEQDWVLLFVGKLEEKKDPRFLLQLAGKLANTGVKLLVVGNGPLEQTLKAEAGDKPVVFLDFQNQSKMPLVYRLGNALILPSRGPGESWGLAANEAMHCGLPVLLSSKVGAALDLVVPHKTGLLFEPGEVEKVCGYIRQLAADPVLYRETANRVRQHIRAFSLEAVAGAIETTLLNHTKKTPCVSSV